MNPNEHIVARADELRDGQMKEVKVGEQRILLSRVDGTFHAVGGVCTHYGAPLAEGVLDGHHVRCPWHHACFDVRTGHLAEPPALDAEPQFEVRLADGNVIVTVPPKAPGAVTMPMARRSRAEHRTFVIVGAGAAGNVAAETLRQDGFEGRIAMITREDRLPYDRPPLSKGYLKNKDAKEPILRSRQFYEQYDIELMSSQTVSSLDARAKTLTFTDGSSMTYDRALIATGATPRRLDAPGANLGNVFALRTLEDCNRLSKAAQTAGSVVMVGASFIAMEAAAAFNARGLDVTIVAPDTCPFQHTLGEQIGLMYQELHEGEGASFRLGRKVRRIEGDKQVKAVVLDDGERIDADIVLTAIGVHPVTDYLKGVPINRDGSVSVDGRMQAAEDLWAAGDIAQFPDWRTGEAIRVEHWRLAQQHGRIAAHNMAGKAIDYRDAPFFWTNQYSVSVGYIGWVGRHWDEIIIDGKVEEQSFLAYYVRNGRVLAVAGSGQEARLCAAAELMRMNQMPEPRELSKGPLDLVRRMQQAYAAAMSPDL